MAGGAEAPHFESERPWSTALNIGELSDRSDESAPHLGSARQRWLERQYSDEHDAAWVRNFHRDDREG